MAKKTNYGWSCRVLCVIFLFHVFGLRHAFQSFVSSCVFAPSVLNCIFVSTVSVIFGFWQCVHLDYFLLIFNNFLRVKFRVSFYAMKPLLWRQNLSFSLAITCVFNSQWSEKCLSRQKFLNVENANMDLRWYYWTHVWVSWTNACLVGFVLQLALFQFSCFLCAFFSLRHQFFIFKLSLSDL